jgi:putative methyltransferase (TIGR04325 family)
MRAVVRRRYWDFEGEYKTFAAVPNPTSHDNAEFAEARVRERLRNWPGPYAIDLLPLVVADYTDVTVVDVGGGAATGLSQIASSLTSTIRLRYILVETAAMCAAVKRLKAKIEFVATEEMPSSVHKPNIVNAASVLQYIDNWHGALEDFVRLKPEAIIISNTPISDLPTYARCQVNGKNRRIPAWCFNRKELVGQLTALGYQQKYYLEHHQSLRHKNAPGPSTQASFIFYPAVASR